MNIHYFCEIAIAGVSVSHGHISSLLIMFSSMPIRAGIVKMLVRIANREDPEQTDLGLHGLSGFLAGK